MTRRLRARRNLVWRVAVVPVVAIGAACGLSACQGPSTPAAVSVAAPANEHLLAFAGTSAAVVLVTPSATATVAGEGGTPSTTGSTQTSGGSSADQATGGSVDGSGQGWLVMQDGRIVMPTGVSHPASAADVALNGTVDTTAGPRVRRTDPWGTAVVDASTALVPTFSATGSTFWHAEDSVVNEVSAAGSAIVAGTSDANAKSISSLPSGTGATATSVRLERVQALVPLGRGSFVLLMNAPTVAAKSTSSRLQAAWVHDGTIRRVPMPDLCASQYEVRASRVDGHQIVLSAPAPDAQSECTAGTNVWTQIDVTTGTSTALGSGRGLATLQATKLVTVTRADASSNTVSLSWLDIPKS